MSQGGPVNQNVSSALWQKSKQWEAVERFANMMFCCLFLLLQGHHKDKNNPPWQICFQKVSLSFSIISEKYCPIVLTPMECFDRGLMYYPVSPVIQMLPPLVLGKNTRVWNSPLGIPLKGFFIPRHVLRHVKFRIWWKPARKHLPTKGNCANANIQPNDRRDHLSAQLDIAGSNLLVLAGVQSEMRILQLMLQVLLINLSGMRLQSTCKIWDSWNYPLTAYNDFLNYGICVQTLMELLNNVYIFSIVYQSP